MAISRTPNSPPARVVDVLGELLDAERNNVIRFMGEGSPHLSRTTADVRRPLEDMVNANSRHVRDLADKIIALHGIPAPMNTIVSEEQYLAFLSLKFLLPKLVHAEALIIQRYESALTALGDAPDDVSDLVNSLLAEHRAQYAILEKAAADVGARGH
jgi:hypothetical protein